MARRATSKTSDKPDKTADKTDAAFPSKDDVLDFVRTAPQRVGKREIARHFGIKGGNRVRLKDLLTEMSDDGLIAGSRKAWRAPGTLPPVTPLSIVALDDDGELIGEPVVWDAEDGPRPRVRISGQPVAKGGKPGRRARSAAGADAPIGIGDRVLTRITPLDEIDNGVAHVGEPIKRLPKEKTRLLGIFRKHDDGSGLIAPIDRRNLKEHRVQSNDTAGAADGDLVRFDLVRRGRMHEPRAHVLEVIGNPEDQRQISLIAVHAHGIPDEFPDRVMLEVQDLQPPKTAKREDLTGVDLITIDPADARDHDDAVHARADDADDNPDGWVVTVAIADVAHYVRPGTRLDREARTRGNSCYFPDRVVPMLPERISNDLCSLREHETRPCLAVRMRFSKDGTKRDHTFFRGVMRSAAKLSYEEAQAAFDGRPGETASPLAKTVLDPLLAAYRCVAKARDHRSPLELDLPERKIIVGQDGRVADIVIPPRLDAHRLIEEFMIQANVAAAETLEKRKSPLIYRAHDGPSREKLEGLRDFLDTLGIRLPAANVLKPRDLNQVLDEAKSLPAPLLVHEVVLRAQSQAVYSTDNPGHFGLNLSRYAHFTSPIRRYADLMVHRALISALNLGSDGLDETDPKALQAVAEAISDTERRAMAAERETVDRLISAYLSDRVGATFDARISGVVRFGLFVRLTDTGADGFVPAGSLAGEGYYDYVEELHALIDGSSGLGYRLGDPVNVRLLEAIPMAGALRFEILSEPKRQHLALAKGYRGKAGKPRGRPAPHSRAGARSGRRRGR